MTQATPACPTCGDPLPPGAPENLCPRCLLGTVAARADSAGTPPAAPDPSVLAPLFPPYGIEELVGRGGMGAVYRAHHRKLDRKVALKILPRELGADPAFAERFLREARAMARLDHPCIVTVHDFGEAGGFHYLVMEFVKGSNLRRLMAQKIPPRQALAIVPQICEALAYAHEHGVVHRDIKPENILVDTTGRVRIADFGLAKLVRTGRDETSLTGTYQVMGTLHYMAPEQIEQPTDVDHRADIFSLGVVFYEMLTGQLPLGRFEPPSRKAEVDERVDAVVLKSLERERDKRYQNVTEIKTDVEELQEARSRELASPKPSHPVRRGGKNAGAQKVRIDPHVAIMVLGCLAFLATWSAFMAVPLGVLFDAVGAGDMASTPGWPQNHVSTFDGWNSSYAPFGLHLPNSIPGVFGLVLALLALGSKRSLLKVPWQVFVSLGSLGALQCLLFISARPPEYGLRGGVFVEISMMSAILLVALLALKPAPAAYRRRGRASRVVTPAAGRPTRESKSPRRR